MKIIICSNCGRILAANDKYCHFCGSRVQNTNETKIHQFIQNESDDLQLKRLTKKFESMNDQDILTFLSEMPEDRILTLQNNLEKQLQWLPNKSRNLNFPDFSERDLSEYPRCSHIDSMKKSKADDLSFDFEGVPVMAKDPADDKSSVNIGSAETMQPSYHMAHEHQERKISDTVFHIIKNTGICVFLYGICVLFWNIELIIEYMTDCIQSGTDLPSITFDWESFSLLRPFLLLLFSGIIFFVLKKGIPFLQIQIKNIQDKRNYELEISRMRRQIEEERIRMAEYQREAEKNAETLRRVLNIIGISKEKMNRILQIAEQIEEADEITADDLAEDIAELISEEKEKILYQKKNEFLSQIFLNDYFKLSNESKNFLITALMIFDRFKDQNQCDFSSICILISKAVELEVKNRYFYRFLDYLGDTRGNCYAKWPDSMLQQYGSPKSICMMGDFRFIMGMNNGKNHISNQAVFISFLEERKILTGDFDTESKIVELLTDQNTIIENIRLNYRNPAAHTEFFDIHTAKNCIGQVLTKDQYLVRLLSCWSS